MDLVGEEEFYFYQDVCLLLRTAEYYHDTYLVKTPCMDSYQTGNRWIMELLRGHASRCYRMFRMEKDVFIRLCNDLHDNYGLRGSKNICHSEILGMFVHMLGHGVGNRLAQERFQHSGETVSRYFGIVLDSVCRMAMDIIKPLDPKFNDIPEEISRDTRYMPHFKVIV